MLHGFLPIWLVFLLFSAQGNILIKEMFQFQIEKNLVFIGLSWKNFLEIFRTYPIAYMYM